MSDIEAKSAIYQVLCHYCRGLDRMDKALAYSVWHEDAVAIYHDMYEGSGRGFVDWVWEAHALMERHSHQITNHLISVDGDCAQSETYVTVALWTLADDQGNQQEIVCRSRYLDRWSRRQAVWAIEYREHILDMQTVHVLHSDCQKGAVNSASTRDNTDASYAFLRGKNALSD